MMRSDAAAPAERAHTALAGTPRPGTGSLEAATAVVSPASLDTLDTGMIAHRFAVGTALGSTVLDRIADSLAW